MRPGRVRKRTPGGSRGPASGGTSYAMSARPSGQPGHPLGAVGHGANTTLAEDGGGAAVSRPALQDHLLAALPVDSAGTGPFPPGAGSRRRSSSWRCRGRAGWPGWPAAARSRCPPSCRARRSISRTSPRNCAASSDGASLMWRSASRTSSGVTGTPSWKVTPRRMRRRHLSGAGCSQDSASMVRASSSWSKPTSGSKTLASTESVTCSISRLGSRLRMSEARRTVRVSLRGCGARSTPRRGSPGRARAADRDRGRMEITRTALGTVGGAADETRVGREMQVRRWTTYGQGGTEDRWQRRQDWIDADWTASIQSGISSAQKSSWSYSQLDERRTRPCAGFSGSPWPQPLSPPARRSGPNASRAASPGW